GALRRLVQRPHMLQAFVLAAGLAILANSRPFEGLVVSLPVAVVLVGRLLGNYAPPLRVVLSRMVLPMLLILGLTAGGMAYYNWRLTSHPWRLAYQQNGAAYAIVPLFIWQPLQPEPVYNHEVIRAYQVQWAKEQYLEKRTPGGYLKDVAKKGTAFLDFFIGLVLLAPLVTLPWIVRARWMCFAALTCGWLLAAFCVATWFQPHYAAPVTGLVFALVVQGLRYLRLWHWHGRAVGKVFVRTVPVIYLALLVSSVGLLV